MLTGIIQKKRCRRENKNLLEQQSLGLGKGWAVTKSGVEEEPQTGARPSTGVKMETKPQKHTTAQTEWQQRSEFSSDCFYFLNCDLRMKLETLLLDVYQGRKMHGQYLKEENVVCLPGSSRFHLNLGVTGLEQTNKYGRMPSLIKYKEKYIQKSITIEFKNQAGKEGRKLG